mmetsp:Transcript_63490/g.169587  ORF Transcript_63490/g.169587 Transcript_63490/m.169587 type:complete len:200 (+) Transcript_63490:766-1365(+)
MASKRGAHAAGPTPGRCSGTRAWTSSRSSSTSTPRCGPPRARRSGTPSSVRAAAGAASLAPRPLQAALRRAAQPHPAARLQGRRRTRRRPSKPPSTSTTWHRTWPRSGRGRCGASQPPLPSTSSSGGSRAMRGHRCATTSGTSSSGRAAPAWTTRRPCATSTLACGLSWSTGSRTCTRATTRGHRCSSGRSKSSTATWP